MKKNNGVSFAGILFTVFGIVFLAASAYLAYRMFFKGANMALNITFFVFAFMGIVYLFIGRFITRSVVDSPNRLMSIAQPVKGTICELCIDEKAMGRSPKYIVCTAFSDGEERYYESYGFYNEPPENLTGKTVSIYIDPKNKKRYYVDLSEILEETHEKEGDSSSSFDDNNR